MKSRSSAFSQQFRQSFGLGHAMLGVSLGPISGKLLAQVLAGEKPAIAIGALNPDRYQ